MGQGTPKARTWDSEAGFQSCSNAWERTFMSVKGVQDATPAARLSHEELLRLMLLLPTLTRWVSCGA